MSENALLLFSLFLAVAVAYSRLPVKSMARDLRSWAVFLSFIFVVQVLSYPDAETTLLTWLPISKPGLREAALTSWRLGLVLCYGVLFTFVAKPRDLQNALIWFLRPFPFLPAQRIALMVSITLRLLPLIMDQMEEVSLATKSRLGNQHKGLLRRVKFLVLPLFRRSVIRADELAHALAARGYREDRPAYLPQIPKAHVLVIVLMGVGMAFLSPIACNLARGAVAAVLNYI